MTEKYISICCEDSFLLAFRISRSASFDRALMVCAASNPMIFTFLTAYSSTGFFFLRNGRPASMVTRASIISAAPT